jgi:hypothetical protein
MFSFGKGATVDGYTCPEHRYYRGSINRFADARAEPYQF